MTDPRDAFVLAVDAELSRLACESMLDASEAGLHALATGFEGLGRQLDGCPYTGLTSISTALLQAGDRLTSADACSAFVSAVEAAWTRWKDGGDASVDLDGASADAAPRAAATTVQPVESIVTTDEDLEMLAMDGELAGLFIAEALDHLGTIEATVLQLEASPGDQKLLNDVFRPFHTIKGNAGALGVKSVQEVAHKVENLLDLCRSGKLQVGPAETDAILKAVDLLTTMISDLRPRLAGHPAIDLRAATDALLATVERLAGGAPSETRVDTPVSASDTAAGGAGATADPVADAQEVPAPAAATGAAAAPATPASDERVTAGRGAAPGAAAGPRRSDAAEQASVKVDTRKLDNLVDMVGELVIVQSIIRADPTLVGVADERLSRNLAQLRRITSDLQRNAMSMRMVPIRQTFQKMARLVRDLGKRSGKLVDLVVSGEDTELDRKVVEDINDPLMHMVRNSVDHGIELPETRESRGKTRAGRLALSAGHQGGNIVIEIADDGRGLDTERILAKATAQGLIKPGETLAPAEVHALIFRPGFSTAEKVTEISGRGVGMDVVRRNIEALRGRIEIQTTAGAGTTFLIKLPLTLAIVEGLLLGVGRHRYVLPTFAVRESLRPTREQVHSVSGRPELIQVRNELMPLVSLADLLGVGTASREPWASTAVVIEDDGRQLGVLVDELLGKQEVVIKSLGEGIGQLRGIAGGAILGDGRVGLILDAGGLIGLLSRPARDAA